MHKNAETFFDHVVTVLSCYLVKKDTFEMTDIL